MDGVIIQSEMLYQERRDLFFKKHHLLLDDTFHEQIIGSNPKEMFRQIYPHNLEKQQYLLEDFNQFKEEFTINYSDILTENIVSVLTWLKNKNYRIGLASSGEYSSLINILDITHLKSFFDVIVSGNDMPLSKPAPDVYLEALLQLELKASDCIAVEDSVHGIQAATSANIECLALKPLQYRVDQRRATKIIHSLEEIPLWLSR